MSRLAAHRRMTPPAPRGALGTVAAVAIAAVGVAALLAATLAAPSAAADDRKLFQESTAEPYVFILLDLSGSMNQSVPCTLEGIAAGHCQGVRPDVLHANVPCGKVELDAGIACIPCPEGACLPRRGADDPESKMRVAKEAIYALMDEVEDVRFGFATFDQDDQRVHRKHWWYRVTEAQPPGGGPITLDSGRAFPAIGQEEIFGEVWNCDRARRDDGSNNEVLRYIGCHTGEPADLDDRWEYERIRRLPKLGDANNNSVDVYVRDPADDFVYRVQYRPINRVAGVDQEVGQPLIAVDVQVSCIGSCGDFRTTRQTVVFEQAGEMVYWEPGEGVRRDAPGVAFFGSGDFGSGGTRMSRSGGNASWEPNTDSTSDDFDGQNLKRPTQGDPRGVPLRVGDVVPWDWNDGQRQRIQNRMAPNTELPGFDPLTDAPDFEIASYFEDHVRPGRSALRLKAPFANVGAPLIPRGGTPTGAAMEDFSDWVDDWRDVADDDDGDPSYSCRSQFLLVLTDGLASGGDGNRACAAATDLLEKDVRSFAIAFGLEETVFSGFNNTLTCIADNGGTGTRRVGGEDVVEGPGPLFPQNKDQLVEALLQVIALVRSEPRTLTGVAVPSVQADAADKVFLTDFTPLNGQAVWAGSLHAFLKPLPLDDERRPDFGAACSDLPPDQAASACYLYDLGRVLLDEQVVPSAADPVGDGDRQRRVWYSLFDDGGRVPLARRFFEPLAAGDPADVRNDLVTGFGLDPADAAAPGRINSVVAEVPTAKSVTLANGRTIDYALGDVFHSDPLVVGAPVNNLYFVRDVGADQDRACDDGNRGYRCFAIEQSRRRRMLFAGANDGMLHAFDIGRFVADPDLPTGGAFDNGSGREMFAYVPRPVMPSVLEMYEESEHRFTVDGQLAAADVFIDPVHAASAGDPVDADERLWRTVLMGGLRRGGGLSGDLEPPARPDPLPATVEGRERLEDQPTSGYYALDVTEPDPVDADDPTPSVAAGAAPGCARGASLPAECGPLPFGSPLWEFRDSHGGIAGDEDGDGLVDLAPTWSTPDLGRILVCTGACDTAEPVLEDRHVAVFGGGLDPERPERGSWLYIVDVETGKAIYKRPLDGAVPSRPAAVDTDRDGYLDRIYIGTTRGLMYRVDLRPRVGGVPAYPVLEAAEPPVVYTGREVDGDGNPVRRLVTRPLRIQGAAFAPRAIFDAGADDGADRPIFFRPSVFYVPQITRYALAFGTGNREDLFARGTPTGRFFVLVDEVDDLAALGAPLGPADLEAVDRDGVFAGPAANHLLDRPQGRRGWWMELAADERLITAPFALAGVLVFSTYQPAGVEPAAESLCRETGRSNVFGMLSTNANGIMLASGSRSRYITVNDFVTAPFTEQSQTKNPPPADGEGGDGEGGATADQLDAELAAIMRELRRLFPDNCRFQDAYRIDIKARSSDTGMIFIAPVPVCVIEKDFREY